MNYNNSNNSTRNSKSWAPKSEKESNYYPKSKYSATGTKSNQNNKTNKNGKFLSALKNTESAIYDLTRTENGALVHSTSGSKLLDLNFSVTQLRGKTDEEINKKFREAYAEDPLMAMKWLYMVYDCRQGLGERNLFRSCLMDLARNGQTELVNELMGLIPEYGRWDMVTNMLNTRCKAAALKVIKAQWENDVKNMNEGKPISLLFKWCPSSQASSSDTKAKAEIIRKHLNMSPRAYRKALSAGRKYLDVVERKMSSDNWQSINYESVPSKANLNYNKAFLRHDEERRRNYLEALDKGEAKINSSVAFPHEIAHKYIYNGLNKIDSALEGMWRSLPDLVNGNESTIVVSDGSGSMTCRVPGSSCTCLQVSQSLAIYFSERCRGAFKDNFITFSSRPRLVDLSGCNNLSEKLKTIARYSECSNTNIEATFDLILKTAIANHMSQEDIPANILILSDCQFDSMTCCNANKDSWFGGGVPSTLFGEIEKRWNAAGYKMPRLIFWNLNCRSTNDTIPVRENENGVALISGFSVNLCKMVMSNKTDPYECLLEAINVPRYDEVERICRKVWKIA